MSVKVGEWVFGQWVDRRMERLASGLAESGHVCGLVGRWANEHKDLRSASPGVGEQGLSAVGWDCTIEQITRDGVFMEHLSYGPES